MRDVVHSRCMTVDPQADVLAVAAESVAQGFGRRPVVDETLEGLATEHDLY